MFLYEQRILSNYFILWVKIIQIQEYFVLSYRALLMVKKKKKVMNHKSNKVKFIISLISMFAIPHFAAKSLVFPSTNFQQQCLKITTVQGFCSRQTSSSSPLVC